MGLNSIYKIAFTAALVGTLSACGTVFGGVDENIPLEERFVSTNRDNQETETGNSIFDLFKNKGTDNTVAVNKYLWSASLEVLNFLPVQSVDPFTGVIVTGFGTPPGGGRSYRATVLIGDPALDARSLNVALQTRGGAAVSKATSRAVEDAILSRAREIRISDNRF